MPRRKKNAAASPAQAGGNGRTGSGRINKMDCVRKALASLGNDAKPKAIKDFLDREFGLQMNTKMISTYKGSIAKNAARQSGVLRAPAARSVAAGGLGVEDVRAVKRLADQLGADRVRELLDVLY